MGAGRNSQSVGDPIHRCPEPYITIRIMDENGFPVCFRESVDYRVCNSSGSVLQSGTLDQGNEIIGVQPRLDHATA